MAHSSTSDESDFVDYAVENIPGNVQPYDFQPLKKHRSNSSECESSSSITESDSTDEEETI